MKRLILALLLTATPTFASSSDEYFFNFDRPWFWNNGSTAWPQWPLYDSLSAIAGVTENPNSEWDDPWRTRFDLNQFVSGMGSLRQEYRGAEAPTGINRSEVVRYGLGIFDAGANVERWYGMSTYIDPDFTPLYNAPPTIDPNGAILFQIHSAPSDPHPPSIYLEIRDGTKQYSITVDYNPNVDSGGLPQTRTRYEIGDWRKDRGRWVDWVIHVVFACDGSDSGGVTQVWKDGWQAVNVTGGNCYNDDVEHMFRFGAYKSWWASNNPPASRKVIVNHDSVRIGNSTRSFRWAQTKRILARNHDTPWKTAGVVRGNVRPSTAGVPIEHVYQRAGEFRYRGR